jgi:hypothetical protein
MIVLNPTTFQLPGYTPPEELQRPFAISAAEVTLEQMQALVPQFAAG